MKCTVHGYGRIKGDKSKKTGQPYDFYLLGISYKGEQDYTGERVKEIAVDPSQVEGIEKLTCPFKATINKDFDNRYSIDFT